MLKFFNNIVHLYYDVLLIISYNIFEKEDFFIIRNTKEDRLMKKKIGLLLATVMVLNVVSSAAFAWESPLKKYSLMDDVMGNSGSVDDGSRERGMGEFYDNSLAGQSGGTMEYSDPGFGDDAGMGTPTPELSRNETLRESSRNVYGDPESTPGWEVGPSFYPEPSFDSIVEKYRKSDFAGCLQECISYVRLHPRDTLGFYYLAMCYTKVSDKDNAILAYEKVIALNSNPMIVKYATNGRNCVMGNDDEKCYQNVNEPEWLYPYAEMARTMDLTPVDPETLITKNLTRLRDKLSPVVEEEEGKDGENAASAENNGSDSENAASEDEKDKKDKVYLPFGDQDEELDRFINSPYGNGFSPEFNNTYKQIQLRKIQETVNTGEDTPEKEMKDMKEIKKFDNQRSDSGLVKLAYETPSKMFEEVSKDPEYIRQKQELDELNMLLGNEKSKDNSDMMDLLPYMSEGNKNLSPEVIQAMMMKSMMSDLSL